MRNKLLLFIFTFPFFGEAQVELNTKNGFIFYQFEHIENNESRCLSSVANGVNSFPTFFNTYIGKLNELNSQLLNEKVGRLLNCELHQRKHAAHCSDTMPSMSLRYQIPGKIPKTVFGNYGPKIWIHAIVSIIFTGNNSYILKVKGFEVQLISSGKIISKTLEEFYEQYLSSKKNKDADRIFQSIQNAIIGLDRVYANALRRTYQLEEL